MGRSLNVVRGGLLCIPLALLACAERERPAPPPFYTHLASAQAKIDAASARDLFNGYRRNLGLAPLVLDEALMQEAQQQADASAAAGAIADGSKGSGKRAGKANAGRVEILSAGYYTVSDAFSGWRGSPSHDAKLRVPNARRLGIATAYASDSKYKVYWAVILAP